jgi:hypothetical protein
MGERDLSLAIRSHVSVQEAKLMTVLGDVRNGTIVLDQSLQVPDGTVVWGELLSANQSGASPTQPRQGDNER